MWSQFLIQESSTDRATERRALEGKLDHAIRSALKSPINVVPNSIPDLDTRLAKHRALAIPKLENIGGFGHVGIGRF